MTLKFLDDGCEKAYRVDKPYYTFCQQNFNWRHYFMKVVAKLQKNFKNHWELLKPHFQNVDKQQDLSKSKGERNNTSRMQKAFKA